MNVIIPIVDIWCQWYRQLQLLISTMYVHCWYQQLQLQQYQFLISAIWIVDINKSCPLLISAIQIVNIDMDNCRYQQIELSISIIQIVDINNYLLISTIGIVEIVHQWYRQLELWISTMYVHYWYGQFQLSISVIHECNNSNCRYW